MYFQTTKLKSISLSLSHLLYLHPPFLFFPPSLPSFSSLSLSSFSLSPSHPSFFTLSPSFLLPLLPLLVLLLLPSLPPLPPSFRTSLSHLPLSLSPLSSLLPSLSPSFTSSQPPVSRKTLPLVTSTQPQSLLLGTPLRHPMASS